MMHEMLTSAVRYAAEATTAAESGETMERLFGLDPQLIFDACLVGLSVFVLFFVLSYMLFNPVRDMLKKRQDKIKNDLEYAKKDRESSEKLRIDYEEHIKNIDKEAELILSKARNEAMRNEADIIAEAKEEAARIRQRAQKEMELEKKRALDDMKQEMIAIASSMAAKAVNANMDVRIQESLVDETIKEMGEGTWQS